VTNVLVLKQSWFKNKYRNWSSPLQKERTFCAIAQLYLMKNHNVEFGQGRFVWENAHLTLFPRYGTLFSRNTHTHRVVFIHWYIKIILECSCTYNDYCNDSQKREGVVYNSNPIVLPFFPNIWDSTTDYTTLYISPILLGYNPHFDTNFRDFIEVDTHTSLLNISILIKRIFIEEIVDSLSSNALMII